MIVWYHKLLHLQNTLILLHVWYIFTHSTWLTTAYHNTQYFKVMYLGIFNKSTDLLEMHAFPHKL